MSTSGATTLLDVSKLPVEQAITKLIAYAVMLPASDIFFSSDVDVVRVSVRHMGLVSPLCVLPAEQGKKCLSHVKAMAGMDLSEKRRPQDGRWVQKTEGDATIDLRCSVIPTLHGEDISLRLLSKANRLFGIEELGLLGQQLRELQSFLDSPGGLVLLTGPTGSGKTATLYAALARLNDGKRKINTIEDPIENAIAGVRQSQVNTSLDLGFSELLKSVLRQSPDVIMIGEIRDAETADVAVRAANSGHLVLATIHAPAAAGAVQSMRGLGVHPHFLSTALRGIVSQRLVRTICPDCRIEFDLSLAPHTFDDVRPWLTEDQGNALHASKGCASCQFTGYAGRTGVFEVMTISRKLRDLIAEGRPVTELRAAAASENHLEFRQSALLKVAQGITSSEEVFRVIPSEQLLEAA